MVEEDSTGAARKAYDRLCSLRIFSTLFESDNEASISNASGALPASLMDNSIIFGSASSQMNSAFDTDTFVGRKTEMESACAFARGSKGLFTIFGTEGIGKSAILEEIAGEIRRADESSLLLTSSGRFSETSTELFPFREIFSQLLVRN